MSRRRVARLALAALLLANGSNAQRVLRSFTADDGLPQNTVNCLLQDHLGFLVFGTQSGIAWYDGKRFTTYRADPADPDSLPIDNVWAMVERRPGELWFGGHQGLAVLDRRTGRARRIETPIANLSVYALMVDASERLWVGAAQGLLLIGDDDRFMQREGALDRAYVTGLAPARDGGLWVATNGQGLHYFDPLAGTSRPYRHDDEDPRSLSNDRVWSVLETSDGTVWAGTRVGLNRLDHETGAWDHFRHHPNDATSLPSDWVWRMLEDSGGRLWVGTRQGGLALYNPATATFEAFRRSNAEPRALIGDRVASLAEDRRGRLWVGTTGGVSLIAPRPAPFEPWGPEAKTADTLPNTTTWGITDAQSRLWICTYEGLWVVDPQAGTQQAFRHDPEDPTSINSDSVYHVAEDAEGQVLVGTARGLCRFDSATDTFTRFENDPENPDSLHLGGVYRLYRDRRDRLWIAAGSSLDRWLGNGRFAHCRPDARKRRAIYSITEDTAGRIVFGGHDGLWRRHDDGTIERLGEHVDALRRGVLTIEPTGDDQLWVGGQLGLVHLDLATGKTRTIDESDGLPSPIVNTVVESPTGELWVSTNWGLARIVDVNTATERIFRYTGSDLLPGNEFNMGSACLDSRGRLHFGGIAGIISFDPTRIPVPIPDPVVIATANAGMSGRPVTAGSRTRPRSKNLLLPPYAAHLEFGSEHSLVKFQFAVMQFEHTDRSRFEYRLAGLDDWVAVDEDSVTYANLPPGEYEFEVRGRNNAGVWADAVNSIRVTVLPAWWQSTWFFVFGSCAAAVLLAGAWRLRTRQLRRHTDLLELRAAERTEELSTTVESLRTEIVNSRQLRGRLEQARKMETFGVIAAGVAHDLNNALSGIVTLPDLLLARMPEDDPMRKSIADIRGAGERAATIVRELQSMGRRRPLSLTPTDLNELVTSYCRSPEFEQLAANHPDVAVVVDVPKGADAEPVTIAAAPEQLVRALANLALNGFECQPGGGRLTLSTRIEHVVERRVRYEVIEPGTYAVIAVADVGTGIEPDDLRRLFEPFFSRKSLGSSGTGLGLTIAWNTVHEHDGVIDVESTPGKGTCFELYLPLLHAPTPSTANEPPAPRGNGESVLVVDDESEQRRLAVAALEGLGYRATAVATAADAVDLANGSKFDLYVLDVMLGPESDGIAAFRAIREVAPDARAILATGHTDEARSALARELGITTRLDKPYTIAALAIAVRQGLDGVRLT